MLGTNKGVQQTSALFSHGPNKAFLVPDSCRPTVRNGSYINVDVTDYIIGLHKKEVVSTLFRQYGKSFGRFDIIGLKPCTYIIGTSIINFALAAKQPRKVNQLFPFLPVAKTRANTFDIFGQCTYISYL